MLRKTITLLPVALLLISGFEAKSQNTDPRITWEVKNFSEQKVFIENKGEFAPVQGSSNVLYAYDGSGTKIFFTKKGLEYSITQKTIKNKSHENNFSIESEEEEKVETKTDLVSMQWVGANANVEVVAEQPRTDYYSYNIKQSDGSIKNINFIQAYEKITYKNLYPGIDVEYVFHPDNGIEYSLILHEGADLSLVKMQYSDGHNVSIKKGNVHISTLLGDIIDHAPSTYYTNDKGKISSGFIQNGNIVSFQTGEYDHSKPVTIDPWSIVPSFPNSNQVWNAQTDGSGNVYLYGGDSPIELKKYNSTGTLQWTYNTPWDSANYWTGTLITDRAGNSFVTSGSNGEISKVSTAGALVWHNNPNGFTSYEYWHESFNCDQTQLVVSGTILPSPLEGAMFNINLSNGAIANQVRIGWKDGINADEGRSVCSAPNGNYYFLLLDSIGSVNSAVTSVNSKTTSTYNFGYGGPSYGAKGSSGNIGFNGMHATANYVYTVNGAKLDKRNIGSLAIVASVSIPGGSSTSGFGGNAPNNGGIDIDSCGNVYVGSGSSVIEFDANLTQITTIATTSTVYDVAVNNNGEVIACGNKFAASLNFSACKPFAPICKPCTNPTITKAITDLKCYGATNGSATVTASGGGPYYFSWSGITDTTATATNLAAGSYIVTVTNSGGCSTFDTVVITQPAQISVNVTPAPSCSGSNGTATAVVTGGTGPFTYSWSPSGGTSATATGLAAGGYTVNVTDKNGCIQTQTTTVASASGSGPTLTMTNTSVTCGACNGTATATPTAAGTYGYIWSSGDTTQTAKNLCAGTYTVTVTPKTGSSTPSVFYTENFAASGTGWTLNINGSGTNGAHANEWAIDNTSALCNPGYYLHVTCSSTNAYYTCTGGATYDPGVPALDNSATDKYASSPNISTVGESSMSLAFTYQCEGNSSADYALVSFSNNGGTTWTDQPTKYSGVTTCTKVNIPIPAAYDGLSNFRIGFRWINKGKGNGNNPPMAVDSISISGLSSTIGCPTVQTVTVPSGAGSFTLTGTPVSASCGANNGTATANPSPTGAYTYKWSDGQTTQTVTGLAAGTYTVIASAGGGCSDTIAVTVSSSGGPSVTFTRADPTCNGSTGTATANVTGGVGPYTYNWTPSGGTNAAATGLTAGVYTCTVTDKNGCITIDTAIITQPAAISGSLTGTTPANCGSSNGSATVSASGGTGTLTYNWAPSGGTNPTASGLAAGTYTCTVTDANGCNKTITAAISNTGGPSVTTTSTSPMCNGGTGAGVANVTGGTGPYTYSWSPSGGSKDTATGLSAGTYTCTVTDKNGCITNDTVKITQPSAIAGTTNITDASCGASNGSVILNTSGGTGAYTYNWSPSGGTTATANNLAAGSYTCTVTDGNGCTKQIVALISNIGAPSVTASQNNEQCFGDNNGTATVVASGGTSPYAYAWSPSGGTNASATNLAAGTYTCVITDSKGCQTDDTVKISQPAALASTVNPIAASCGKPGNATVTPVGGTGPYTYSWSPTGGTNMTATGLAAGTYTCSVTDANGCKQVLTTTITGNAGPVVSITPDTTINPGSTFTIVATGGGTYHWSPATGLSCDTCPDPMASPSETTTYCVLVTDSTGCADSTCMTVDVETPCGKIFVPNAFSPNGDHENDLECVYGGCIKTIDFSIYDRWGNKVFETQDPLQNCWDGKYKGELMNTGVFVYYLQVELNSGEKMLKKGNITLVR